MTANTFDEYVLAMAEESPHAVMLDWYRRLELMLGDYVRSRDERANNGPHVEHIIGSDPLLGPHVSSAIAALRLVRNEVSHESKAVSPEEAYMFARQALDLIGTLWQACDAHAAMKI